LRPLRLPFAACQGEDGKLTHSGNFVNDGFLDKIIPVLQIDTIVNGAQGG
jgi:hypothetical protein